MERLTYRLKTGEVLMATEYEEKYTEDEWICILQDRLAAYEDTGLTPEEVDLLSKAGEEGRVVVYDTREEAEEALRRAENGNC